MGQRPKDKKDNRRFIEGWSDLTKKPLCKKCGAPTLEGLDVCASFPKCKHRSKRRIGMEAMFGKCCSEGRKRG